jgi:hypothetical protein
MKIRFAVAPGSASSPGEILAFSDAIEASSLDGIWLSDLPSRRPSIRRSVWHSSQDEQHV